MVSTTFSTPALAEAKDKLEQLNTEPLTEAVTGAVAGTASAVGGAVIGALTNLTEAVQEKAFQLAGNVADDEDTSSAPDINPNTSDDAVSAYAISQHAAEQNVAATPNIRLNDCKHHPRAHLRHR